MNKQNKNLVTAVLILILCVMTYYFAKYSMIQKNVEYNDKEEKMNAKYY